MYSVDVCQKVEFLQKQFVTNKTFKCLSLMNGCKVKFQFCGWSIHHITSLTSPSKFTHVIWTINVIICRIHVLKFTHTLFLTQMSQNFNSWKQVLKWCDMLVFLQSGHQLISMVRVALFDKLSTVNTQRERALLFISWNYWPGRDKNILGSIHNLHRQEKVILNHKEVNIPHMPRISWDLYIT